jgi:hypothetical protein
MEWAFPYHYSIFHVWQKIKWLLNWPLYLLIMHTGLDQTRFPYLLLWVSVTTFLSTRPIYPDQSSTYAIQRWIWGGVCSSKTSVWAYKTTQHQNLINRAVKNSILNIKLSRPNFSQFKCLNITSTTFSQSKILKICNMWIMT